MNIIISNSSGKPIYEQITAQIKGMIMNGTLSPGDSLPSMRLLAKELRISVITTKRAYEDLERDGFIDHCGERQLCAGGGSRICKRGAAKGRRAAFTDSRGHGSSVWNDGGRTDRDSKDAV